MLEFHDDALVLSGMTGTKLKCSILSNYYRLWWNIASGGPSKNHRIPTALVEMNAGTGEVYVKETRETILGSAEHALELKIRKPDTWNLTIALIEENEECYSHLKKVMRRRWPDLSVEEAERPPEDNGTKIYLMNKSLSDALDLLQNVKLGTSIFFFDPLLYVDWESIEKVAERHITSFLKSGTEFIIFLFTSD